jgi:hypothetical protein
VRILFDQGVPAPLREAFADHSVTTAYEKGWATLANGELLDAAEQNFDVFVTTDQNLRFQQNLSDRRLAMLVLPTTSWPHLQPHASAIAAVAAALRPGELVEWTLPD